MARIALTLVMQAAVNQGAALFACKYYCLKEGRDFLKRKAVVEMPLSVCTLCRMIIFGRFR